jgi:hypothetical protein
MLKHREQDKIESSSRRMPLCTFVINILKRVVGVNETTSVIIHYVFQVYF